MQFFFLKKTSSLGSNTLYCKLKQRHLKRFGTFKKTLFFDAYMGEGLKLGEKCEGWIKYILFHWKHDMVYLKFFNVHSPKKFLCFWELVREESHEIIILMIIMWKLVREESYESPWKPYVKIPQCKILVWESCESPMGGKLGIPRKGSMIICQ